MTRTGLGRPPNRFRAPRSGWYRRTASERGSQLVELALSLPVLLLLLLGMADFGFLLQAYAVVNNAAREGARLAVVEEGEGTEAQIRQDVQYLVAAYITQSIPSGRGTPTTTVTTCELTINPAGGGGWLAFGVKQVEVVYPYTYRFVGGIAGILGTSFTTVNLRTSATMRIETPTYPTSGPTPSNPCPS